MYNVGEHQQHGTFLFETMLDPNLKHKSLLEAVDS